jgi:hypothetical protein
MSVNSNLISAKCEKLSFSNIFFFITGVVDTGDY